MGNLLRWIMNNPFKTVSINDLPEEAWVYLTGQPEGDQDLKDYYKSVPWLFRGVRARANAVASMPFSIYRGKEEVDSSNDYQNVVKVLPNPRAMLTLVESALTIWGYAYAIKERNQYANLGLRYLLPSSVKCKIDSDSGDIAFTRQVGSKTMKFNTDAIMYWWASDPYVEIGPPNSSPAMAACSAAGVLFNVDAFTAAFFKRGAIKATLLTTKNIRTSERSRLKEWWKRMFGKGTDSAWQTDIINADAVTPVVVGEGLESLENSDLSESKRIDISVAMGVPYSKLFSGSASGLGGGGVVKQDDLNWMNEIIIPECEFIAEVLNTQYLDDIGFTMKFTPENLDMFQEDENARANSLVQIITALSTPDTFLIAAEILGYEIDPKTMEKIVQLVAAKEARRQEMAERTKPKEDTQPQPAQEQQPPQLPPPQPQPTRSIDTEGLIDVTAAQLAKLKSVTALKDWRRIACRAVRKDASPAIEFESEYLDPVLKASIMGALEGATTEDEVKAVFDDAWKGYP